MLNEIKKLTFNGPSAHITHCQWIVYTVNGYGVFWWDIDSTLKAQPEAIVHSRTGWSKNNWLLTIQLQNILKIPQICRTCQVRDILALTTYKAVDAKETETQRNNNLKYHFTI